MSRFEGRAAIVTGAGSAGGIGAAVCRRLHADGAKVLVTDLAERQDEAERYCAELRGSGPAVVFQPLDVTDEAQWADAVERCVAELGVPRILVNNAGANSTKDLLDETLVGWHHVLDVNMTGPFLGIRAVVPGMLGAGGGAIVNVSSVTGLVVSPAVPGRANVSYHASKGGLTQLAKVAAVRYAKEGIRVNTVHPGAIETDMMARGGRKDIVLDATPMGRLGTPDEVADAVAYLASDEAAFVTGASMLVDGGYVAV